MLSCCVLLEVWTCLACTSPAGLPPWCWFCLILHASAGVSLWSYNVTCIYHLHSPHCVCLPSFRFQYSCHIYSGLTFFNDQYFMSLACYREGFVKLKLWVSIFTESSQLKSETLLVLEERFCCWGRVFKQALLEVCYLDEVMATLSRAARRSPSLRYPDGKSRGKTGRVGGKGQLSYEGQTGHCNPGSLTTIGGRLPPSWSSDCPYSMCVTKDAGSNICISVLGRGRREGQLSFNSVSKVTLLVASSYKIYSWV